LGFATSSFLTAFFEEDDADNATNIVMMNIRNQNAAYPSALLAIEKKDNKSNIGDITHRNIFCFFEIDIFDPLNLTSE